MQYAFNFTLEKMIFLKKHNNSIKVGLFFLIFWDKGNEIFLFIIWDGRSISFWLESFEFFFLFDELRVLF